MGTSASYLKEHDQLCDTCSQDISDIGWCDTCKKNLCTYCCEHRTRKKKNLLFNKKLSAVSVQTIIDEPKQKYKRVRCASFMHNGKLAILSAFYIQDKHCQCCDITALWNMCFLDRSKYRIGDRLHDTETHDRFPGSIATSKTKKITYMTSPSRLKVYRFTSSNDVREAFPTDGKCFGITSFDNGLAITINLETDFHTAKWQVHYLDFQGTVKKRIIHDKDGNPLFGEPLFLASNMREDILFVSDYGNSAILALSPNALVLFKYTSSNLKRPWGITVDTDHNIYVADGHTVVQIEAGGKDSVVLLDTKSPQKEVAAVCFDSNTMSIVVIQKCGKATKFFYDL